MVLAILQARTSSHRLPRKVLRTILGRAMILRQLDRLKNSQEISRIILATSLDTGDDELASTVVNDGVYVYRGSLEDVLSRYYECARTCRSQTVVRVTGDCPVIDWRVVDDVIRCHLRDGNDYTRTTDRFPDGLDTEVISFDALEKTYQEAKLPAEHEHVTLYIRKHPELFRIGYVDAEEDWSSERWTVDEPQDLLFIKRVYELLYSGKPDFDMYDILGLLQEYPALKKINAGIRRDEGLLKSLREDFYRRGQNMGKIQNRKLDQSNFFWDKAQKIILSGCQLYSKGPETHIRGVSPIYIDHGKDAHVWDVDGNEYIDYDMGLGPILLGYQYKAVDDAVMAQLRRGMGYSLVAPEEVEYAELCVKYIPSAGKVRFLKTGSSATEAAVRIARCYTGRKHIVRGEYHGWHEWTTAAESVRQGGILPEVRQFVHKFDYNDLARVEEYFETYPGEVAAVITEAVEVEPPKEGFLTQLKDLCHRNGALLIFDEVVNGFRFSIGGAQAYFGVTPDLSTFGKAAANGMPLSIVAGRKDIMEDVDKKIFISTTFGGDCLSLAAGIAVMKELESGEVTKVIWEKGRYLQDNFRRLAKDIDVPIDLLGYPCRLNLDYADYDGKKDWLYNSIFMQESVKRGVLLGWHIFPCYTHTQEDLDFTLNVFEDAMKIYREALKSGHPEKYMEGIPLKIVLG